jgi:alpha-galactosidase
VKFLDGGDVAVGFFNLSENRTNPCVALADIGLGGRSGKALKLRNLWTGEEMGVFKDQFVVTVEPHGCVMLRGQIVDA